jgi:hypothetical protein
MPIPQLVLFVLRRYANIYIGSFCADTPISIQLVPRRYANIPYRLAPRRYADFYSGSLRADTPRSHIGTFCADTAIRRYTGSPRHVSQGITAYRLIGSRCADMTLSRYAGMRLNGLSARDAPVSILVHRLIGSPCADMISADQLIGSRCVSIDIGLLAYRFEIAKMISVCWLIGSGCANIHVIVSVAS